MIKPTITTISTLPNRSGANPNFDADADTFFEDLVDFQGELVLSIDYMEFVFDEVEADSLAVEASRVQVVNLAAQVTSDANDAALAAAASATTGIDASAFPIGSKLTVIPDGAGGRFLSMHPGAVPQTIVSQTGAAITFDLSAASEFKAVLDQDATITFDVSGLDAQAGTSYFFEFSVIQPATDWNFTWGSPVKFDNDIEAAHPDALQRAHYVGKYDVDEAVFYLWQTARTPV